MCIVRSAMIAPFSIHVPDAAVTDLKLRLERTQWPDDIGEDTWQAGIPQRVLCDLVDH